MHDLRVLRSQIHEEAKRLRNIDYMLGRFSFENLWALSDDEQKEKLRLHILAKNKEAIINWYKNHPYIDIGEQSLAQLRETGKDLCVPNYSRLNKIELLSAIKQAKIQPICHVAHPMCVEDLIKEIRKYVDLMLPLLIEANVPDDYLDFPNDAVYFELHVIEEAHNWILEIYNNPYRGARSIKNLLSDEMWERYRTWNDFGDHREVVLLTEAIQKLRKAVMNGRRPNLFKKQVAKLYLNKLKKMRGDD